MNKFGPHGPEYGQDTPEVFWVKPQPEEELGELQRVAETLYATEKNEEIINKLQAAIAGAASQELSDEAWAELENNQAWSHVRAGFLDDAETVVKENEAKSGYKKNFPAIVSGFKEGEPMEMPVVLKLPNGKNYLISGNTRLMVARAFGIRPKVLVVELPGYTPTVTTEDGTGEPEQ